MNADTFKSHVSVAVHPLIGQVGEYVVMWESKKLYLLIELAEKDWEEGRNG